MEDLPMTQTIPALLDEAATIHDQLVAIEDGETLLSFAQLRVMAHKVAKSLVVASPA